jgi:hypothetical protein
MTSDDEVCLGAAADDNSSPSGGAHSASPLAESAYRAGSCIGLLELMDPAQRARFKHALISRALLEVDAALSEALESGRMDEEADVYYLAQIRSHLEAARRWLAEHGAPSWSALPPGMPRLHPFAIPPNRLHDAAMNLAAAAMTDDLVDVLFWTVNAVQFRRYLKGAVPLADEQAWQLEIAWAIHQGKEPPLPDAPPGNPL